MSTTKSDQDITSTPKYIWNPKTMADLESNVAFQLANVEGFVGAKEYECALIKARFLVANLEALLRAKHK